MNSSPRGGRDRTAPADTIGLANTRARIVGARTGFLADSVVALVRASGVVSHGIRMFARRLGSVITPLGWVVIGLSPIALISGYLLGWQELIVAGWACIVLAVVATLVLIGRAPFAMTLELQHRRAVVGDEALASVDVSNTSRLRSLAAVLEVPVGPDVVEVAVPSVKRGSHRTHDFTVPTLRRGIVPVGPVRTLRADPLGLVRREVEWTEQLELVVHPATISVPSTSTGLIRDLEGSPTRDLTSSDVAFHALREYQAGDDRRHIHWRSTAKTGTYMVRQFEQTRRSHLVVALSLSTHDFGSEEEFELAVSVAGSLGVRAVRDGRTIAVVVSALTPEFAKKRVLSVRPLSVHLPERLLDDLAVVEAVPAALPLREVARVVADGTPGISVAFLIGGSRTTAHDLQACAARFPVDVEVLAIVCDLDAEPGMRRIGGVRVLTIGYLDELRSALARSAAIS